MPLESLTLFSGAMDCADAEEEGQSSKRSKHKGKFRKSVRPPPLKRSWSAPAKEEDGKEAKSSKAKTAKKKAKPATVKVKAEDAYGSLNITTTLAKSVPEIREGPTDPLRGKWPVTAALQRDRLDNFIAPQLTTMLAAPEKSSDIQRQRHFYKHAHLPKELFVELDPVPTRFRQQLYISMSLLACTYTQPRPLQLFHMSQTEAERLGACTYNACSCSTAEVASPRQVQWVDVSLTFSVEPHPFHLQKDRSCCRLTWVMSTIRDPLKPRDQWSWDHQAVVFDLCRREACFLPPLPLGRSHALLLALKAAVDLDQLHIPRSFESLRDRIKECTTNTTQFRSCSGAKGIISSTARLSSLYSSL